MATLKKHGKSINRGISNENMKLKAQFAILRFLSNENGIKK